jgi:hypothetical protein
MERSRSARVLSTPAKLGALVLLAMGVFDGAGRARAQDASADSVSTIDPAPIEEEAPTRAYFQQFPDEPGALTFEQLSPKQQEAVMFMAERTDYSPDVHAAWSAIAHRAAADAAAKQAAYASGMSGLDEVGVQ